MIKLLRFVKPYAWAAVMVVLLVLGQVFADLNLPNLLSRMIDVGIAQGDQGVIWQTGLAMLGLTVYFPGPEAAFDHCPSDFVGSGDPDSG